MLYPAYQQQQLHACNRAGHSGGVSVEIDSPHGHDAFLINSDQLAEPLARFFADACRSRPTAATPRLGRRSMRFHRRAFHLPAGPVCDDPDHVLLAAERRFRPSGCTRIIAALVVVGAVRRARVVVVPPDEGRPGAARAARRWTSAAAHEKMREQHRQLEVRAEGAAPLSRAAPLPRNQPDLKRSGPRRSRSTTSPPHGCGRRPRAAAAEALRPVGERPSFPSRGRALPPPTGTPERSVSPPDPCSGMRSSGRTLIWTCDAGPFSMPATPRW